MKLLSLIFIVLLSSNHSVMASQSRNYEFKVFLDETEIGQHNFIVTQKDDKTFVSSKARFDVKFLFFTAYTYIHEDKEVWQNSCLKSIEASTDDNGDLLFVRGDINQDNFNLESHTGKQQLVGCIRTFAYWDIDLLNSKYLLNSQTGELVAVTIEPLGMSEITMRGVVIPAQHYRIYNADLSIELWYSDNHEWLALESTTESGDRLRYQIQ